MKLTKILSILTSGDGTPLMLYIEKCIEAWAEIYFSKIDPRHREASRVTSITMSEKQSFFLLWLSQQIGNVLFRELRHKLMHFEVPQECDQFVTVEKPNQKIKLFRHVRSLVVFIVLSISTSAKKKGVSFLSELESIIKIRQEWLEEDTGQIPPDIVSMILEPLIGPDKA